MVALRSLLTAFVMVWASPAAAELPDRWAVYVVEASSRFDVPAEWIRRVIVAESGGRTVLNGRPIVSRAGAMGLMQLMPGTWRDMRALLDLGSDPHDPRDNILAGTAYLRMMHDRFGYPGLFAAYNAGPTRYARSLAGERLPRETIAYLAKVAGSNAPRPPSRGGPLQTLFALRPDGAKENVPAARSAPGRIEHGLFVPLVTAVAR